jgi:hypothetical protein
MSVGVHGSVEAERQLVAAADRHREVVASMQGLGRPVARLVPAGRERGDITQTAAGVRATARTHDLTREIVGSGDPR